MIEPSSPSQSSDVVDLAAVREKYRREREKRLHKDGSRQYRRLSDELAHYKADPYTPVVPRDPIVDETLEAVVIGGGFGGLLLGARLREVGVESLCMIE